MTNLAVSRCLLKLFASHFYQYFTVQRGGRGHKLLYMELLKRETSFNHFLYLLLYFSVLLYSDKLQYYKLSFSRKLIYQLTIYWNLEFCMLPFDERKHMNRED